MKIVFVTDVYYPSIGGVEIETKRLANELSKDGHNVSIIAPSNKSHDFKREEGSVTIFGIKSYFNPFYQSLWIVPPHVARKEVFKILGEISPDIIHIQTGFSLAKAASLYSKKFGVASVATGHYAGGEVESGFEKLEPISKFVGFLIKTFNKSVWKNVDLLTFPSNSSKEYFYNAIKDQDKILILSNGVDTQKFSSNSKKLADKNIILYVGRLEPHKRVETVIRSMPKILSKINADLVLVGGGGQEDYLRKLVSELGIGKNVIFTGFVSEEKVRRIYKKASLLVTASLAENQPLVILEAIASGLPIVATNVGGIPDLVRDGKNGYLFNPGDSNALAKNVVKILLDKSLAVRMRKESLEIARMHDSKKIAFQLQTLYQKALAIKVMKKYPEPVPFYRSRVFRLAFAIVFLAFLIRISLTSPSVAHARGISVKDRIKNSKIVRSVEKLSLKLEASLHKK